MSEREIVQVVEIDVDFCGRTYGSAPCLASLNAANPRKCYNTFGTCQYKEAYQKQVLTLKFVEVSFPVKNGNYIPALVSVGGYEQQVNIAGYQADLGGLGRRASVQVKLADFPYRDVLTDKYWRERISGAAQIDEGGYDPIKRGTFWTKFKARNANYAGRTLRHIEAHYTTGGDLVYDKTRAYVMDSFDGPDSNGQVTIVAKDILSLADDEKAQCPRTSNGKLAADITANATTATLTPAGIGNLEYPAEGFAVIGSEIVRFTRVNNTLTLTRARQGTEAATHSTNDTVQVCYNVNGVRADAVIRGLLTNYANIPASYFDIPEWTAEFNKWGNKLQLAATICKPTSVVTLIGEICQLGITVWWDEIRQKIRVKLNHPPEETPIPIGDDANIVSITQEDNEDERATRIAMWSVQIDPTKELSKENFIRGYYAIYVDAESVNMYNGERTKTIYTRWLNQGNDSAVKIIAGRLLTRYKQTPTTYEVTLDAKDDLELTDVVSLSTYLVTDITGKPTTRLAQVYSRSADRHGHRYKVKLQKFEFDARYGVITENSRPVYGASTEAQKNKGTYFVGPSLVFSDGRPAYQLV